MKFNVTLILLISNLAFAGREGGGGELISAQFATVGRAAINILNLGDPKVDKNAAYEAIKDTRVVPVDSICMQDPNNGIRYCLDAIYNKGTNTILFNVVKWKALSCKEKLTLASHELLRVAGLETEDYRLSGRFINNAIVECSDIYDEYKRADCSVSRGMYTREKIKQICDGIAATEFKETL